MEELISSRAYSCPSSQIYVSTTLTDCVRQAFCSLLPTSGASPAACIHRLSCAFAFACLRAPCLRAHCFRPPCLQAYCLRAYRLRAQSLRSLLLNQSAVCARTFPAHLLTPVVPPRTIHDNYIMMGVFLSPTTMSRSSGQQPSGPQPSGTPPSTACAMHTARAFDP